MKLDDSARNSTTKVANLADVPPDQITIGMPVEVIFDEVTPEISLPRFRRVP